MILLVNLQETNLMKKILFLVAFILIACQFSAVAQDELFDPVVKAFRESDARALSASFNVTVELRLPDNEDTYSASQTEMILKEFFKKYPSESFNILEKGATDTTSRFAIGNYSSAGKNFQVYVYLREEQGRFLIHKLRVDEKK